MWRDRGWRGMEGAGAQSEWGWAEACRPPQPKRCRVISGTMPKKIQADGTAETQGPGEAGRGGRGGGEHYCRARSFSWGTLRR